MSAFQDITDQEKADEVELSENVADDFIRYFRGNVVGHEAQGWLMYLGLLTGWTADKGTHVNTIGIGPPGSGKSLTKNTVEKLFDGTDTYTKTSASSNAILDSVEWDLAIVALMDEYDKIDKPIVEVLKSSNPVDDGFSKDRNVEDPDAHGGYRPEEVSAEANPWILLYAPTSKKGGVDDELEDRALILYFSNNKHTRRGILRKEFGHDEIVTGEAEDEYIYDTHKLAARLRQHVRELPTAETYQEDDDGNEHLSARSGNTHTYMPKWVAYACEPIFDLDADASNRVFGIINNLMRSSALLNHHERPRKSVEVYVDEDSTETETREAIVVGPQDVANILSCLPTLLSTTHQLTPLKRQLLDAVDATQGATDGQGATVTDIQDWLDDNDIPHPSRTTLKDRLDDLAEDYYLNSWDNAGGRNGQATVYELHENGALEVPNVRNMDGRAERDNVELGQDDEVTVDLDDPFADCTDPIRDQPFKATVREFEEQFTASEASTDASSFMGPDDDSESDTDEEQGTGQASLDSVSEDGVDVADEGDSLELDPEREPQNPTEQYVYQHMETDTLFSNNHDVSHYLGIVDPDAQAHDVDTSGSVVDPTHELWQDRSDLKDDRVINEGDALRELHDAYRDLVHEDVLGEDESAGPPAMFKLRKA